MILKSLIVTLALVVGASAQHEYVTDINYGNGNVAKEWSGTGAPSDTCPTSIATYIQTDASLGQNIWKCVGGHMRQQGASTTYTLTGATSSALGGVKLASGQSSTTLATIASTGAAGDLTGLQAAIQGLTLSLSNPLLLPADPTTNMQAATKQYVDAAALPIPQQKYGKNIYDKASWSSTSDFSVTGTAPTFSHGSIVLTGSASFDAQRLALTSPATADDDTDFQVTLTVNTVPNGVSDGIFLGRNAFSGNYVSLTGEVIFGSGSTQLKFWQQATGTPGSPLATQSASIIGVAVGDTVALLWSQRGATVTLTVQDLTQEWTQQYAITSTLGSDTTTNFHLPATSRFVLGGLGASYNVNRIRIVDQQSQSPYLTVFGDSKVTGGGATSDQTRWASMLSFGPVDVAGGPGDETAQLLNAVPFIIAQHPQNVLLSMGSNDIRLGAPSATWQANYSTIVADLKAAGIRVIHLLPIPENTSGGGVDQSALKTWIQTTFASDPQIDPSVGWSVSTDVAADGVHPSPAGHQFLANLVSNSAAFSGATPNTAVSSLLNPIAPTTSTAAASIAMFACSSSCTVPMASHTIVYSLTGSPTVTLSSPGSSSTTAAMITVVSDASNNTTVAPPSGWTLYAGLSGAVASYAVPAGESATFGSYTSGGSTTWLLLDAPGSASSPYSSPGFNVSADAGSGTYSQLTLNNNNADGARVGLIGGIGDAHLYLDVPGSGAFWFRVNNSSVAKIDASGDLTSNGVVIGNAEVCSSACNALSTVNLVFSQGVNVTLPPITSLTATDVSGGGVAIGAQEVRVVNLQGTTITVSPSSGSSLNNGDGVIPPGGSKTFTAYHNPASALYWNITDTSSKVLSATSAAWTPGTISAGNCVESSSGSGDTTVAGATSGMTVQVTPVSDPGPNTQWFGWVVSANTVRLKLCNALGGTPVSAAYAIRVTQ